MFLSRGWYVSFYVVENWPVIKDAYNARGYSLIMSSFQKFVAVGQGISLVNSKESLSNFLFASEYR